MKDINREVLCIWFERLLLIKKNLGKKLTIKLISKIWEKSCPYCKTGFGSSCDGCLLIEKDNKYRHCNNTPYYNMETVIEKGKIIDKDTIKICEDEIDFLLEIIMWDEKK